MSFARQASVISGEHRRRLRALGITPLELRQPGLRTGENPPPDALPTHAEPAPMLRCAVVLPRTDLGESALQAQAAALLSATGLSAAQLLWVASDDAGALAALPKLTMYLALGHAAARALGEALPSAQRESALVVVTESAPAEWRRRPGSRRSVWQALRPLRRAMHAEG